MRIGGKNDPKYRPKAVGRPSNNARFAAMHEAAKAEENERHQRLLDVMVRQQEQAAQQAAVQQMHQDNMVQLMARLIDRAFPPADPQGPEE